MTEVEHVIEVAFKGNRREFFRWKGEPPAAKAWVVVEADRGEDVGRVHSTGELAVKRGRGTPHGYGNGQPELRALRVASAGDVKRHEELRAQDEDARRKSMERVHAHKLEMKVSDAEWRWDRRKLTVFFSSEKRVDFRDLVRDLAALFRARIELKQIGVRDEARRLSGIGRCGREYCSAAWLPDLRPVNLGVAKDQRLSLNPTQISGACGRLMCCLRFEHEFYVQQRRRFPKELKIVTTTKGEEKVTAIDIFRERVTLRAPDGEVRVLTLAEFNAELGAPVAMTADQYTQEWEIPQGDLGVDSLEAFTRDAAAPPRRPPLPVAPLTVVPPPAAPPLAAPPTASPLTPTPPTAAPSPPPIDAAGDADEPEAPDAPGSDDDAAASKRRRRGRRGGRRHKPGPGGNNAAGGGSGGTGA